MCTGSSSLASKTVQALNSGKACLLHVLIMISLIFKIASVNRGSTTVELQSACVCVKSCPRLYPSERVVLTFPQIINSFRSTRLSRESRYHRCDAIKYLYLCFEAVTSTLLMAHDFYVFHPFSCAHAQQQWLLCPLLTTAFIRTVFSGGELEGRLRISGWNLSEAGRGQLGRHRKTSSAKRRVTSIASDWCKILTDAHMKHNANVGSFSSTNGGGLS